MDENELNSESTRLKNDRFQLTICHQIGFGTLKAPEQVALLLEKSGKSQGSLAEALETTAKRSNNSISGAIYDAQLDSQMHMFNYYVENNNSEEAVHTVQREIGDLQSAVPDAFPIPYALRAVLAEIHFYQRQWSKAEELWIWKMDHKSSDQANGISMEKSNLP